MKIFSLKFLVVSLIIAYAATIQIYLELPNNQFKVSFFDVGQGDAALIKTPENNRILIDGGPDNKIIDHLENEIPFFDKEIDLLILTHPHDDHIFGLINVIKEYEVKAVLITGVNSNTPNYAEFLNLIEEKNLPIFFAGSATDFIFGELKIDILYPFSSIAGQNFKDLNDSSIIVKIDNILFMGDASKKIETKLIKKYPNLDVDILKVGHHGSKTATSEELLQRTTPQIAIISAGSNNKFGHPHTETITLLKKYGVEIKNTSFVFQLHNED